jgi:hypothetical protein
MEVKPSLREKPKEGLIVRHPKNEFAESIGGSDDKNDGSSDEEDYDGDDEDFDDENDSCWKNVKCTNERRICQSHGGYGFDECVAQAYPIDELILEDISQDGWFVSKNVTEMENREKRSILYWWCMVKQTETATFMSHQGNTRAISESERRTVRGLQTSKETKEVSIHDTELFRSKHV